MPVPYEKFVQTYKDMQTQGQKPTYDLLSRSLGISKGEVSTHMKRMRSENPHFLSAIRPAPSAALIKAFFADVTAGIAMEREALQAEMRLQEENEEALAKEIEELQAYLDEVNKHVLKLEGEAKTLQAERDAERARCKEAEERLYQQSLELAKLQARMESWPELNEKAVKADHMRPEISRLSAALERADAEIVKKDTVIRELRASMQIMLTDLAEAKAHLAVRGQRTKAQPAREPLDAQ